MRKWTYLELRTKLEKDLDLEEEQFIQPEELLGYFNEAIDLAEADLVGINEDYLLTATGPIALTTGVTDYVLPDNIFASKIRSVIYQMGLFTYEVKRLHRSHTPRIFTDLRNLTSQSNVDFSYILRNDSATSGPVMSLSRPPTSGDSGVLTTWFIRQANRLYTDTDVMDLPEAAYFILSHVKMRCYQKEGHPLLTDSVTERDRQRQAFLETLDNMTPDDDNRIEMDMTFYEDHS